MEKSESELNSLDSEYEYLPHQSLFLDKTISLEEREVKTFFYSTLYLITNNKFLMDFFLKFIPDKEIEIKFYDMIKSINNELQNIKVNENPNQKNIYESINKINEFQKSLKETIKDPRHLLAVLLEIMKIKSNNSKIIHASDVKNSKEEEIYNNIENLSSDISNYSIFNKSKEKSFVSMSKYSENEVHFKEWNIVIKITKEDNEEFMCPNFIEFKLTEEEPKVYKLEDCFKNYLDEIKDNKIKKKVFYKFPASIIIILFFGKGEKKIQNYKYDFDEVLDFSKFKCKDYFDKEVREKKYILGGLIACKFPKSYNKFFYTFYRKNRKENNSPFYMYNSKKQKVKEVKNVDNKLKKLNEKKVNVKEPWSYPYILIYDEIKD